jgi:hypothetical protein
MNMKDLKLFSKQELLNQTQFLVQEERKLGLQLIDCLREVECRLLYAELGYPSLWEFCTRHLGLSEGDTHRKISVMRLAREVPQVKEALETGKLSQSSAAQLQTFFKAERKNGQKHSLQKKEEIIASARAF